MTRILVVGGYGVFGSRVARRLAREADLDLVIAGRGRDRSAVAAADLAAAGKRGVSSAVVDARTATAADLAALAPAVVINASGPFQGQDYTLAKAAIGARCHYIDLADARDFVTGVGVLDAEARAAGVLVVSGASSVPGVSSAVVARFAPLFQRLRSVEIGIFPTSSFDPGVATVKSVLGGAGKPFQLQRGGQGTIGHGWLGLRRRRVAGLGWRWLADVDVPDLDLFPRHYPELDACRFGAGFETSVVQLGLAGLAWLAKIGCLDSAGRFARPLLAVKRRLAFLGGETGGMFVTLDGLDHEGRHRRVDWTLIARHGSGPFVPAIPSVILAKRLARGTLDRTGACPCFGLFPLDAFAAEVADLDIAFRADVRGRACQVRP